MTTTGCIRLGSAPFRLVDHKDDLSYTVERNPYYWDKGKPYLDRINWKIIPLDATRLVELRSGGAHIAEDLPLQNVEQMRSMSEIVLSERPGARFYFTRWNMDNEFGKSLEDRAPATVAAFLKALPVSGDAFQDQYSSQVMRITSRLDVAVGDDRQYAYQYPGLLMLDPTLGQLALCFGRGRLQNAIAPIAAVPIAEVGGDLGELNRLGDRLQFDGAGPISSKLRRISNRHWTSRLSEGGGSCSRWPAHARRPF